MCKKLWQQICKIFWWWLSLASTSPISISWLAEAYRTFILCSDTYDTGSALLSNWYKEPLTLLTHVVLGFWRYHPPILVIVILLNRLFCSDSVLPVINSKTLFTDHIPVTASRNIHFSMHTGKAHYGYWVLQIDGSLPKIQLQ